MKCPFCHKELVDRTQSTLMGYVRYIKECPTLVKFEGKVSLSHFKAIDYFGGSPTEEYWHIPPYQIFWSGRETMVGIHDPGYISTYTRMPHFKPVFHTPERIHPDNPEKILARIRLLTLFS